MKVVRKDEKKNVHVAISGECSIYDVEQMHSLFCELLKENKNIRVDFSGVTEMDTAVFQLLIALKKEKKSVSYCNHTPAILKFIDLYGLAGFFGDPIRLNKEERNTFTFSYGVKREKEGE